LRNVQSQLMSTNRMNVIIRADADVRIGTGHIMRCIALAQAWQDQGGDVTFLSHCDSKALRQRIIDEGFEFIPIEKPHPEISDLGHTLEILEQFKIQNSKFKTWVVLDGYHFTPDYQEAIRENGYRLLVIDDMVHLDHYHADILLNQNIHASSLTYSCDRDTVKFLGCEYVLLRREFLKYKDWKREIPEKAKKILVTMGGSDPDNVTLKVIMALNSLNDPDLEVKIVAGPTNPNINSLKKELHFSPSTFHLLPSVRNMPKLMAWADIAVSAGGSTCWEMAFMGLANIIITLAENQRGIVAGLDGAEMALELGWFEQVRDVDVAEALFGMLDDRSLRQQISCNGRTLVDGKGSERVALSLQVQTQP
jgi:UDP-2,4-diacetamido-2,4,6-trideoxy-beta-L-altropyranose hydrolase